MLLLAFVGGVLAVVSPCILPLVPFVFTRTGRPFIRATVPMLAGLAFMFAAILSLTTAGATWIARANDVGRFAAIGGLALVGASLLIPRLAVIGTRPIVALGARLAEWTGRPRATSPTEPLINVVVGMALGLLWAPCAGPILGLVVSAAALGQSRLEVGALSLSFSLGAVSTLAVLMTAGGRLLSRVRPWLGAERWIRQGLGAVTLAGVLVLASGWDRSLFAVGDLAPVAHAERLLVSAWRGNEQRSAGDIGLPVESGARRMRLEDRGAFPDLGGGSAWINSGPLTPEALKGKVVLVWFWTFQCYNCLNALPHVKALDARYRDKGLVVIGVHTPELPRERVESNVRDAVKELGITYPVVVDDRYAIWNRWNNQYWPAAYYVDKTGRVRFHRFGEGSYDEQDAVVQQLLAQP